MSARPGRPATAGFFRTALLVAATLLLVAAPGRPARAQSASADDTARFLAGMPVPSSSALAPLAAGAGWKQHAASFDAAFARVEKAQLAKVRDWSRAHLGPALRKPTLYYFFSGPDFLYANAFFPEAGTYVLVGLEPVGAVPDLARLKPGAAGEALRSLRIALRSLLGVSFFITEDMKSELRAGPVTGTLPVLYAFLARSGKTIGEVALVRLSETGEALPEGAGADRSAGKGAQGARIRFSSPGGPSQTLYYFSANLANDGFGRSALGAFGERLGEGDALVKSASYLLHSGNFSQVRSFLMGRSAAIVQDDTGPPVALYDPAKWDLKAFGRYVGPISLFADRKQPRMTELFARQAPGPLGFGIGYRHRPSESSLLLAVKKQEKPPAEPAAPPPELGAAR